MGGGSACLDLTCSKGYMLRSVASPAVAAIGSVVYARATVRAVCCSQGFGSLHLTMPWCSLLTQCMVPLRHGVQGPMHAAELVAGMDLSGEGAVDMVAFFGGDGTVYEGVQVRAAEARSGGTR